MAVDDYCYLLSRGYAAASSSALVGNRYRLNKRQRTALLRIGTSEVASEQRRSKHLTPEALSGKTLAIDGFNLLILLEAALSGGVILLGRDGAYRDMASISGSYKRVKQTEYAIDLVIAALKQLKVGPVQWYLDAPISNSGKLKQLLLAMAESARCEWSVELVADPDKTINARTDVVAISGDSFVIDESTAWFNLAAYILHPIREKVWLLAI